MREHNFIGVGGLLYHQSKYLLVRHSYGEYNEQWIIPGGFVKDGEHPSAAVEREVFEETSIKAKSKELVAVRTRQRSEKCLDCYLVFTMDYLKGEAISDGKENSAAGFFNYEEVLNLKNVIPLSKIIIEKHHNGALRSLELVKDIDPYTPDNQFLHLYI
ncbi:NUDIX domain-containing protein [Alkaliphilus hydrothermalis]|uniref:ADP-ribose pyrophosphatase YjhB (NUDIX family) n=1 Tax=Alkaliphilus hydrothermalis TaxID=1482730 RepID=A0ABS2NPM5_9FIRM|nr:NUDIX domain-containing protein [Alkaliphilus hydrothermalis]MBM7614887.1 ADP-ribose pyrophosphatase YjhB (NUDIX family) [Alkaliphilus hydrothermalis]